MVNDMNNSIILCLILLLAYSSFAAPLSLSGDAGRAILGTIDMNNSTSVANTTNETQLWNWGKLPVGHLINTSSGKLASNPINDGDLVVVPPRSGS